MGCIAFMNLSMPAAAEEVKIMVMAAVFIRLRTGIYSAKLE